jgi:outer membrane protein assembly factor BamB
MTPLRSVLMVTVWAATALSGIAADWPQFLGPTRNGVSGETGLIDTFAESGPKIVWRTALGTGMSGVAVSDGVVYTLFQDEDNQYAVAVDELTGDVKWKTRLADAYQNSMGNGPRATPAVVDHTVFALTGEGLLAALATENGQLKWEVDSTSDLRTKPADYGMASSPLVVNDVVVVHVGAGAGAVAGYSIESGARVWAAGTGSCGYSSPALMNLSGTDQVVSFVGENVMGISPSDGLVLWSYPFKTDYECNIAVPVGIDDSSVLISSGENHGSVILRVSQTGGKWSVDESWSSFGKNSVLRAEWQTPVVVNSYLFGLDNMGSAGPITNLVCIDLSTGSQAWLRKRFGKSNLTLADGKLFISTMNGELVIVQATSEGFRETGRSAVVEMTRQAPAIANGRLYLRDDREVVCIDVRANK